MDKNNFCVIMAGGVGSRFWPISTMNKPKQFLDILNTGRTFLQQTYDRFVNICPIENIYIVTNVSYRDLVISQLPELLPENILLEPLRKNTAPCIAYANFRIKQVNPDANIVVAPSDHVILKEAEFIRVINEGLEFTKNNPALLTLGIKPNKPETGYGYIQVNNEISVYGRNINKVKTFTEKPDYEMAKFFVESGEFFWNSGIFLWSLRSISNAFENYLPDVNVLFQENQGDIGTNGEENVIKKIYAECKNISIDYGIMEKAENVYVLCSDFGWSDLGTWGSLYEIEPKNEDGNVIGNNNVFTYETKNCIINLPKQKLVVTQGLENLIVVESDDILLICKMQDEQQLRFIVNDVKIKKGEEYI
jgi:mannose-1-phosphate guanylyltransferase